MLKRIYIDNFRFKIRAIINPHGRDFGEQSREGVCKQQAQKLARELCPNGLPADSPPSLHTACEGLNLILS